MKIKSDRLVCDVCGHPFDANIRIVQEWITGEAVQPFYDTDDSGASVSYTMFLRKFATAKTYKHAECSDATTRAIVGDLNRLDAVKAELAKLDSCQQQSVYEFLHDACGRRMW